MTVATRASATSRYGESRRDKVAQVPMSYDRSATWPVMPAGYAAADPDGRLSGDAPGLCLQTERRRAGQTVAVPKFIAFLRAVNVGKRKYPMAELREALATAGFEEVETHIQTGNVLFRTSMRSRTKVIEALEAAMLADRGFEVPVVLMTPAELTEAYDEARSFAAAFEQQGNEIQGHYLTLLAEPPDAGWARRSRPVPNRRRRSGSGDGRCTCCSRSPTTRPRPATRRWSVNSVSPPPVT